MSEAKKATIVLSEVNQIGKGAKRICFVHPENPDVCIKVPIPGNGPEDLYRKAPFLKRIRKRVRYFDENYQEWTLLSGLAKSGDPDIWQHLPKIQGWVETDRGRGLALELIRDADGTVSRSFLHHLWQSGFDSTARIAQEDFVSHWRRSGIPSRRLGLHNILAQVRKDGSMRLVVIDGLGCTEFIPISSFSKAYARSRSRNRADRVEADIMELMARRERGESIGKYDFMKSGH